MRRWRTVVCTCAIIEAIWEKRGGVDKLVTSVFATVRRPADQVLHPAGDAVRHAPA